MVRGESIASAAFVRRAVALVAVLVVLGTGCSTRREVIDPSAQPIVDRMAAAPEIRRWAFTYRPLGGSPYVACLAGIDEVRGLVDLDAGTIHVEPNRDAPSIVITDSSILVAASNGDGRHWSEISLVDDFTPARMEEVFGPSLAGFIANGLREPHPNLTALAAIDVATSVERDTSSNEPADTISITVDPDGYRQALVSEGQQPEPTDPIPQLLVTVDGDGLVTALAVVVDPAEEGALPGEHGAGYLISATYGQVATATIPDSASTVASIDDIRYPPPGTSCIFEQ